MLDVFSHSERTCPNCFPSHVPVCHLQKSVAKKFMAQWPNGGLGLCFWTCCAVVVVVVPPLHRSEKLSKKGMFRGPFRGPCFSSSRKEKTGLFLSGYVLGVCFAKVELPVLLEVEYAKLIQTQIATAPPKRQNSAGLLQTRAPRAHLSASPNKAVTDMGHIFTRAPVFRIISLCADKRAWRASHWLAATGIQVGKNSQCVGTQIVSRKKALVGKQENSSKHRYIRMAES